MTVLDAALLVLGLSLIVAIVRIVLGPTDADRVIAVDFGFVVFVAAVALLAVRAEAPSMLDLVLVATLVGFLSTVALARRVERGAR
ncbi:monovalent cation/H+ antiporter complex subunit F [Streptomyces sp. ST2-7A]|uniref:monovalent cation/H+ antiporter complex subunit F n=1 Tax=Streptomyces sp. ST2-7A TaxID=2907214 RepID=UPI001F221DA0|nr:monovalent cation/H+ antiporter complex subunit F [Streptomyces sp. ST2-7A]MCE7082675.1 monovalent cation/H+ antiporter complex subunit F [Streptomyces sp. ST2-7A]